MTGDLRADLKNLFGSTSYKMWFCTHHGDTQRKTKERIPENLLSAIEHSVKTGAEIIELDARPIPDDMLVLVHNNTIGQIINGSGTVGDFIYQ